MTLLNKLDEIVKKHTEYRSKCLNMIASEVVTSPTVRRYLLTDFLYASPEYIKDSLSRPILYMGITSTDLFN